MAENKRTLTDRQLRELSGMKLSELAAAVGISKGSLSKHETGKQPLSPTKAQAVRSALRRGIAAHFLAAADALNALEAPPGYSESADQIN